VQPVSTLTKPPTGTAEERVMCAVQAGGLDVLNSEVWEARDLFDLG